MTASELTFIIDPIDEETIDALAGLGIDWSQTGRLQYVHIDQPGTSFTDRIRIACDQLHHLGVQPRRLHLDLVSASEIAARAGVSRPAVTNWTKQVTGAHAFPIEYDWSTTGPVWVWADVNDWLKKTGKSGYDEVCSPDLAGVEEADRWITQNVRP